MTEAKRKVELLPSEIDYGSGDGFEEILNSITHAMGAGLSVAALAALLVLLSTGPVTDPWRYAGFLIYGATQILLYFSSALLHGFSPFPEIRAKLNRLDHASIYLLIAGTYTPVALTVLRGPWGWSLFGVIWTLAVIGVVLKLLLLKRFPLSVDLLYLPMGWLILVALKPLINSVPPGFIAWAVAGGLSYSIGFIFYAWKKLPFSHVIWHLFVLSGSISFFVAFAVYLV
jgi:hemolysin III